MSAQLGTVDCASCSSDTTVTIKTQFFTRNKEIAVLRGANFNTTDDQVIFIPVADWILHRVWVSSPTGNISAAVGGIYDAANKGGNELVPATQDYTALVDPSTYQDLNASAYAANHVIPGQYVYLSLTTACGSDLTADVFIEYEDIHPLTLQNLVDGTGTCERVFQIPGPQGDPGSDGADGSNGSNAYTTTALAFVQPAVGADVTVPIADGNWMSVGQVIFVEGGGDYEVQSATAISMTIRNLGYAHNAAPAAVIGGAAKVSPSGEKGDSSAISPTFDTLAPVGAAGGLIVHNGSTYAALAAGVTDYMVPRIDTALAQKIAWEIINLSTWTFSGALPIARGGTGSTTAASARTALAVAKNGVNTDITSLGSLSSLRVDATNGIPITGIFSNTATLTYPLIATTASNDQTMTITGASVGDTVALGSPAAPTAGIVFYAFVSAPDTVTVRAMNITGGNVTPGALDFTVTVFKQ